MLRYLIYQNKNFRLYEYIDGLGEKYYSLHRRFLFIFWLRIHWLYVIREKGAEKFIEFYKLEPVKQDG